MLEREFNFFKTIVFAGYKYLDSLNIILQSCYASRKFRAIPWLFYSLRLSSLYVFVTRYILMQLYFSPTINFLAKVSTTSCSFRMVCLCIGIVSHWWMMVYIFSSFGTMVAIKLVYFLCKTTMMYQRLKPFVLSVPVSFVPCILPFQLLGRGFNGCRWCLNPVSPCTDEWRCQVCYKTRFTAFYWE